MSLRLSQQGLMLAAIPLALELCLLGSLFVMMEHADTDIRREVKTRALSEHCTHLYTTILNTGATITGFIATTDEDYLKRYGYDREHLEAEKDLKKIRDTVGQDSLQLNDLNTAVRDFYKQSDHIRDVSAKGSTGLLAMARLRPTVRRIETAANNLVASQGALSTDAPSSYERVQQIWKTWMVAAVLLNALLALGLWQFFNRSAAKRLNILVDNSLRLASQMPLNERLDGGDEFAQLDGIFHSMTDALNDATRKRTELLEMVAHDLRSPLMAVNISLTMLERGLKGTLPEEALLETQTCSRTIDRLLNMINVLLDIEIITSGNMPLELTDVSLTWIIDRSVDAVRNNAIAKQQEIDYPDHAQTVNADGDRIEQVLINLLSNAIKFSPPESKITVTAQEQSGWVEVRVIDNGRGIAPGASKRLFGRYQQQNSTDKQQGKGLGLSICKAIVEAHHGMIGVDSEEGKGSQFWFRLPQRKSANKTDDDSKESPVKD
ncbi:hypothetical protein BH10CYA1_BH10CYA1_04780 [soil metagenome]